MLSGIPASRLWRSRRAPTTTDNSISHNVVEKTSEQQHARHATNDSQNEEELASLNNALECLTNIFQDVQIEVLREMLSTFSAESRLQLVTECLLKHKAKWVKGRWRIPSPCAPATGREQVQQSDYLSSLPSKDRFRSPAYKMAVREALYREFKNLNHSVIKAILAEHNFSYLDSRVALIELMSKSWRISVTNLIFRRKLPSADQCPLVCWQDSGSYSKHLVLIPTPSQELNEELENGIISEVRTKARGEQMQVDSEYARQINEEEAEIAGMTFECQCCFIPSVFEAVATCGTADHFVCYKCISSSVNEAIFGQGWASSIDPSRGSLRCIALSQGTSESCKGFIPQELLEKAILTQPSGAEIWTKYERKLAEGNLVQLQDQLSRCPFCGYAELHAAPSLPSYYTAFALLRNVLPVISICLLVFRLNPFLEMILATLGCLHFSGFSWQDFRNVCLKSTDAVPAIKANFGTKFVCRNKACSRVSCLRCQAAWMDTHICHQSSRQALRTFVESAITDAIKRTCPKCNLSFVKSSGCNKLVCVCGYSMCYICRQDVGKEGYTHFCPHFRVNPGQACDECDRCDLYRTEDEEKVIAEAKQRALATWKEQQKDRNDSHGLANELENDRSIKRERETKKWAFRWF